MASPQQKDRWAPNRPQWSYDKGDRIPLSKGSKIKLATPQERAPNVTKVAEVLGKAFRDGVTNPVTGRKEPVTEDWIKGYLPTKGFASIKSYVDSLQTSYGITDSVINGMTWNWGSEIQAIADTMTNNLPYEQNYKDRVLSQNLYSLENPVASTLGEIGGGLATGVPAGIALERQLAKTALLQSRPISRVGATGAIEGGIAGGGADNQRLLASLMGIGLGYGTAALTTGVVALAQGLKNFGKQYLGNTQDQSDKLVERFLDKDKLIETLPTGERTAQPAIERMSGLEAEAQQTGVPMTLMEAGPNMRALGQISMATPSRLKKEGLEFLEQRQSGQIERATSLIGQKTGLPRQNVYFKVDEIVEDQMRKSRPAYDQAYKDGEIITPDTNPDLWETLVKYQNEDWFKAGAKGGAELSRLERMTDDLAPDFGPIDFDLEFPERPVSLAQLDYVKRYFGDYIDSLPDTKKIGKQTKRAKAKQLSEYVDALDEAFPSYGQARNDFAVGIEVQDALEEGEKFMRLSPDKISHELSKMTDSQKGYYKMAAVEKIYEFLRKKGEGADISLVYKNYPEQRERLKMLFDSEDAFNEFLSYMKNVEREAAMTNKIRPGTGSPTQPLQALEKEMLDTEALGPVMDVLQGRPVSAATNLARGLGTQAKRLRHGVGGSTADALGPTLLETNPAVRKRMLEDIMRRNALRRSQGIKSRGTWSAGITGGLAPIEGLLMESLYE